MITERNVAMNASLKIRTLTAVIGVPLIILILLAASQFLFRNHIQNKCIR